MPKIFEWDGYKFFFFSNEGIPREPCHVHIRKSNQTAKFWVNPYVSLATANNIPARELLNLQKTVQENSALIRRMWDEYFSD
jgi:hypothetical protein